MRQSPFFGREQTNYGGNKQTLSMIRDLMRTMLTFAMLFVALALAKGARADDHREHNKNYILRRQQIYPSLGVPTSRLIIGRREIDIYRNGMMFEGDHLVGIKPRNQKKTH